MFQLPSHLSELEHLKIAVNRLSAGTQKHFRFNYLSEMNGPLQNLRIFPVVGGAERTLEN